jgi:hypothetical protein
MGDGGRVTGAQDVCPRWWCVVGDEDRLVSLQYRGGDIFLTGHLQYSTSRQGGVERWTRALAS